jgi:hypothetical protein
MTNLFLVYIAALNAFLFLLHNGFSAASSANGAAVVLALGLALKNEKK